MGKTLTKARKKAAKAALQVGSTGPNDALAVIAKRLKYKLPSNPKKKVKLVPIISEALNAKAWDEAVQLFDMLERRQGSPEAEVPKLGAVMRWVRVADLAGTEAVAAKLLAAIMRVAAGPQQQPATTSDSRNGPCGTTAAPAGSSAPDNGTTVIPVRRFPPWRPPPACTNDVGTTAGNSNTEANGNPAAPSAATASPGPASDHHDSAPGPSVRPPHGPYAGRFAVVPLPPEYAGTNANGATAAAVSAAAAAAASTRGGGGGSGGAATTLPNIARDLTMFCTEPGTIRYGDGGSRPPVRRAEVPFVPGAFVLVGALSRHECAQIVACAEEMGYTVDPDYTFSAAARAAAAGVSGVSGVSAASAARNGGSGGGERGAAGCVWLADESLQGPLYDRLAHLLPQSLCGGDLAGINARWRLYRYDKGAVYRPHVDGAWPGSGLRNGRYEFDAYGDRWSRLTFLVYLNDDFEGGATTFYTPAPSGSGACLEAHSVQPVAGNVLVFPHGDTTGSLVHEGAAVTRGSKYVIRTEVLYKLAPGVRGGGVGAPQPAMQLPAKAAPVAAGVGAAHEKR